MRLFAILLSFASALAVYEVARNGDEIIVCGRSFRIGTPVVTFMDEG